VAKGGEHILRWHVWVVATCVPLLVRLLPLKALLRLLTPPGRLAPYSGVPAGRIAEIVRRRLHNPIHMRRRACLREGLTLFHFLCLAGAEASLHMGVYAPQPRLRRTRAHCWVTCAGRAASAPPAEPFAEVLSYPSPRRRNLPKT
jgi:hypothetical protein